MPNRRSSTRLRSGRVAETCSPADRTRPDQTRPDQARPGRTRPVCVNWCTQQGHLRNLRLLDCVGCTTSRGPMCMRVPPAVVTATRTTIQRQYPKPPNTHTHTSNPTPTHPYFGKPGPAGRRDWPCATALRYASISSRAACPLLRDRRAARWSQIVAADLCVAACIARATPTPTPTRQH